MPRTLVPDPQSAGRRRQTRGALVFVAAAAVMLVLPPASQEALASALRATALRPFVGMQSSVVAARLRAADLDSLRMRLDSATARWMASTTLAEENARLRDLLGLAARTGPEWRAARLLRTGTPGSDGLFLLDVGERDGVAVRAPVIAREGIAGVVREVRAGSATGMDWTHPDFRAGAMSEDGTVQGLVEPRRIVAEGRDRLMLSGTPFTSRLEVGTVILTSGVGGVFPRGIPIGRVVGIAETQGTWSSSYWLEPFVEPGNMADVLVSTGVERPVDLAGPWTDGPVGTREELARWQESLTDSLDALLARVHELEDWLGARSRAGAQGVGSRGDGPAGAGGGGG